MGFGVGGGYDPDEKVFDEESGYEEQDGEERT